MRYRLAFLGALVLAGAGCGSDASGALPGPAGAGPGPANDDGSAGPLAMPGERANPGLADAGPPAITTPPPEGISSALCEDDDKPKVRWSDLYNVMALSCVSIGCHSSSDLTGSITGAQSEGAGNFALANGAEAYEELLDAADGCEGKRVVPGDPEASVLVQKLRGEGCGDRMPLDGEPMPDAFIEDVVTWIESGAQNDLPSACGVSKAPPEGAPTFTEIYETVLKPSCGGVWCHDPYQSPDEKRLDVATQARAYNDLVNVLGVCMGQGSEYLRVKPGEPDKSLLVLKLEDNDPCGIEPMPLTLFGTYAPLPAAQIQRVRDWIAAGAPNN